MPIRRVDRSRHQIGKLLEMLGFHRVFFRLPRGFTFGFGLVFFPRKQISVEPTIEPPKERVGFLLVLQDRSEVAVFPLQGVFVEQPLQQGVAEKRLSANVLSMKQKLSEDHSRQQIVADVLLQSSINERLPHVQKILQEQTIGSTLRSKSLRFSAKKLARDKAHPVQQLANLTLVRSRFGISVFRCP
ncbi:MAG: hypothetical protein AABP62_05605 [Planctomycetota bacterium]